MIPHNSKLGTVANDSESSPRLHTSAKEWQNAIRSSVSYEAEFPRINDSFYAAVSGTCLYPLFQYIQQCSEVMKQKAVQFEPLKSESSSAIFILSAARRAADMSKVIVLAACVTVARRTYEAAL